MNEENKTHSKGEAVPEAGIYVCVPCGFKKEYQEDEKFGECTSCLAGTSEGSDEYAEGLELWEKLNEKHLNKEE
ncbi:hypothetical protein KKC06_05025 [Patescibacteria group bacterium]|nr:hypothetical protein [Patescibacteria group bacterium]